VTNPAAETKSIGLHRLRVAATAEQGRPTRMLSWFLHRHQDNFTVTGQLAAVYRDSAVKTTLSGRVNLRPFTGTLQKLMPAADTDGN